MHLCVPEMKVGLLREGTVVCVKQLFILLFSKSREKGRERRIGCASSSILEFSSHLNLT